MARTIAEIKKEMTDAFMDDETLQLKYGFDPSKSFNDQFSRVSIESLIFSIVASSIWLLEQLFDKHQEEVSNTISKRAHTLVWYREKALAFQFGYDLRDDICEYDNTGLSDEEIQSSKIVAKCSCESVNAIFPTIKIKAVTNKGAMTEDQLNAFSSYMYEIADAGVQLSIVSKNPDKLGLSVNILYDPLLMNGNGKLYNEGTDNAVAKYIDEYLATLEYNGKVYPDMLENYLMTCAGVRVAQITAAYVKSGETVKDVTGEIKISPASGAFEFDNSIAPSLRFTYKPFGDE